MKNKTIKQNEIHEECKCYAEKNDSGIIMKQIQDYIKLLVHDIEYLTKRVEKLEKKSERN